MKNKELKTLKDLVNRGSVTINSGKRLKAEAIKWVKDKGKYLSLHDWLEFFDIEVMGMSYAIIEEDLK